MPYYFPFGQELYPLVQKDPGAAAGTPETNWCVGCAQREMEPGAQGMGKTAQPCPRIIYLEKQKRTSAWKWVRVPLHKAKRGYPARGILFLGFGDNYGYICNSMGIYIASWIHGTLWSYRFDKFKFVELIISYANSCFYPENKNPHGTMYPWFHREMVRAAGFEPTVSWSQTKRDTKLR